MATIYCSFSRLQTPTCVFVIKPTRCTNFTNLFCHETCRISWQNKFVKLVHLVGFFTKKFVTMHCHMNVKFAYLFVIRRVSLNVPSSWNFLQHRDVGVTQREVIFGENFGPTLKCCESKHTFTEECMFIKLLIRMFPGEFTRRERCHSSGLRTLILEGSCACIPCWINYEKKS
jgi:hypothetical protein